MLKDYVNYQSGTLIQRLEVDESSIGNHYMVYDQNMLDIDLGLTIDDAYQPRVIRLKDTSRATVVRKDDIVISMITGECTLVSSRHDGSILPYNYTKIEVNSELLEPAFLVYWFQLAPEVKSQYKQYMQGGSTIKKLTHQQLKSLHITLPTLKKQRLIGYIGVKEKQLNILKQRQSRLKKQFLTNTLFKEDN
ncbi:restriction endonuclease subunit S [Staphylococcus equorum]|uniref:Restriction endonuclease subunit S n=1 Tax=Staphylococcus equorum TaxID=246432 RepID=A0A9X4L7A2_9STAP|nr:restriction endonuclease subunit S [Staphylococcus equorum]MDG0821098.1 restriction endonuclease subunit S [Staphylococcus equorum]MDG0847418.1 restriction endonuclease subunit S [Staphylococcus equorum]